MSKQVTDAERKWAEAAGEMFNSYLAPLVVAGVVLGGLVFGMSYSSGTKSEQERKDLDTQNAKIYRTAYKSSGSAVYNKVKTIIVPENTDEHTFFDRALTLEESNLVNRATIILP